MPSRSQLFLGRASDGAPFHYDPDDLTTHAVVVGMTGSGKTGLCIGLLEEAALNGLPAIVLDPKGDLGNLLLTFPDLAPGDFVPWVSADEARRAGLTPEAHAAQVAARWRAGLAEWGIGPERIAVLKRAAEFSLFTPGSEAGQPVSILASLRAPDAAALEDAEALRDRIGSTVTALLGLAGVEADPVRSREHILLAHLFQRAWSDGHDLDLGALILQIQRPPFDRLGVLDVDAFFPEADRMALAMSLNHMLAAPAFQAWMQGEALDVGALLSTADGRPRIAIFYLAHLAEAERMFFVTLLLTAVEAWLHTQAGSASLRGLLYFDEIAGYMPPHPYSPPSKPPLLRMLKQARAFGFGLVLVTQNPADLDYKGLSNAGSWFVGKLQTEQDKARLLDGLDQLDDGGGRGGSRSALDSLISRLKPRTFLLKNVRAAGPIVFESRWTMSYLAGPLTRAQLRRLRPSPAPPPPAAPRAAGAAATSAPPATRPAIPSGIAEYFVAPTRTVREALAGDDSGVGPGAVQSRGLLYRPALLAQASVRFVHRKSGLNVSRAFAALVHEPDRRGAIAWEEAEAAPFAAELLDAAPSAEAWFEPPGAPLTDARTMAAIRKSYVDFLHRSASLTLLTNPSLGLTSGADESAAQFRARCADAARERRDAEAAKAAASYDRKIQSLQDRLARESSELESDRIDLEGRKREQMWTDAENVVDVLRGRSLRRSLSASAAKRRLTAKARADVEESEKAIRGYRESIAELEAEKGGALQAITDRWAQAAGEIQELRLSPSRADIAVEGFGVAWLPFHQLEAEGEAFELPAF